MLLCLMAKKKMKCDRRKRFEMIYYLENITGFFFSNGKILIHATSVQEFTGVETVLDFFFSFILDSVRKHSLPLRGKKSRLGSFKCSH